MTTNPNTNFASTFTASVSTERALSAISRFKRHARGLSLLLGALALLSGQNASANTQINDNHTTTGFDMTVNTTYSGNATPTSSSDVVLNPASTANDAVGGATPGATLNIGTLNSINTSSAVTIVDGSGGSDTIVLNGGSNSVAGAAANDLIYDKSTGLFTISTDNLSILANGNFDIATGASMTVTSNITNGGFTITKTGAGSETLSGIMSGLGGFTNTLGNSTFTGANIYTGQTVVNGGILALGGANGSIALSASPILISGGEFRLDDSVTVNTNRVDDSQTIVMNGGLFDFLGGTGAVDATETVGAITANVGAAQSNIAVQPQSGGTAANTLTAASLNHSTGQGIILVDGVNLGQDSLTVAQVGRIILTATPNLVGGTAALSTGINAASQNTSIVPYLVGETTALTTGAKGGVGTANTFLTYNATTGLRPLNPTDEFSNTAISGNNVYIRSANTTSGAMSINSLVLNGTTANLTIASGTALTDASGAILFVTGNNTITSGGTNASLAFGANEALITTANAANTAVISANITGTGGFTKSGPGNLTLSGADVISGNATIASGTLIDVGGGSPSSSQITVSKGATFQLGNGTTAATALTANNTVILNNAALSIQGTGTAANYGAFAIQANGNSNITFFNTNVQTATLGGTITLNNTGGGSQTLDIGENSAANIFNLTGVITGNGDLTIQGTGNVNPFIVNLTQAENYTGNTFITAASSDKPDLVLNAASASLPSGTILTEASGTSNATFNLNGHSQTLAGLVASVGANNQVVVGTGGALTLNVAGANGFTYNGVVSGAGNVIKAGTGTETFSGINTYTGSTIVNAGILALTGNNTGVSAVTVNSSGELLAQGTTILPLSTDSVKVNSGGNVTIQDHAGGVPNMTNSFNLSGAGTSGSTVGGSGTLGYGALAFFNSGNFALTGNITLASDSLILDDANTQTSAITFSGVISGPGALTLGADSSQAAGRPYYLLTKANTYGTANASTILTSDGNNTSPMLVELSSANVSTNILPSNTVVTFGGTPAGQAGTWNKSVTLQLDGVNQTLAGLQVAPGATGIYTIQGNSSTASTLTFNNTNNYTFSGNIGSAALNGTNINVVMNGTGREVLSGNNTYNGTTTINSGDLGFGNASSLGSGTITINAGAALDDTGFAGPGGTPFMNALNSGKITTNSSGALALVASDNESIDFTVGGGYNTLALGASVASNFTGTINPGSNGYILGGGGATLTLPNANTLTGGNALTIGSANSTGTVALTAPNNFTGGTTVVGSTLSFGDSGAIGSGNLTINAGAIDSSVANLSVANNVSIGGSFNFIGSQSLNLAGPAVVTTGSATTINASASTLSLGSLVNNAAALTFGGAGSTVINGAVNTNQSLTVATGGNLTLANGGNTSAILVNRGILNITGGIFANSGGTGGLGTAFQGTNGGTLNITGGTLSFSVGGILLSNQSGQTINISGGTFLDTVASGFLQFGNATAGSGAVLNLNSGSFITSQNFSVAQIGATGAQVNFNGATLATTTNMGDLINPTFKTDFTLNVQAGGAVIDVAPGTSLGIQEVLTHNTGASVDGGLTKLDTGTLTLSGVNTYNGATLVTAGMLQVGNGTSGSLNASSAITVNSAASIAFDEANNAVIANNISNSGTVIGAEGSGITNNISGAITGSGTFTQSGVGTTILSGNTTNFSSYNVMTGNLAFAGGNQTITGSITDNGSVIGKEATGVTDTLSGNITGTGTFNQTGAGTTILTGTDNYSGKTFLAAGKLQLGNGTTGSIGTADIIGSGGSLVVDEATGAVISNNISLTGGSITSALAAGKTNNLSGVISGTGSINSTGGGTLIISNTNNYSGGTTVNTGSANILVTASGGLGTGNVTINGATSSGTLQLSGGITLANNISDFQDRNTLADLESVSGNNTLTGNITETSQGGGTGFLIQSDAGSLLTLSGNISGAGHAIEFLGAGNSTVTGVISGSSAMLIADTGTGKTTFAGSTNNYTSGTTITSGTLQLGDGTNNGNAGTGAGGIVDNSALIYNEGITGLTETNVISGNGTVTQSGPGVVTLAQNNSYTGTTTVTGGSTLAFNTGNVSATGNQGLGAGLLVNLSGNSVGNSGTVDFTGGGADTLAKNVTVTSGFGTIQNGGGGLLTVSGTLTKNGTNLILNAGSGGIDVTGSIVGSAANSDLYVENGTVSLNTSTDNYSGATHIYNNGYLVDGSGTAPSTTTIVFGDGSEAGNSTNTNTFDIAGQTQTVAGLTTNTTATDTNIVTGGAGSMLNVNEAGIDTFSGNITGSLALNNTGAGTLILTGSNTYNGGTTITSGTLQLGNGLTTSTAGTPSTIVDNGALVYNESTSITEANVISGTGSLTQAGVGTTVTLNQTDTYNGSTTVAAGTLQIGDGTSGSINGASAVSVSSGATLAIDEANNSSQSNNIVDNGTVVGAEGTGIANTLSGNISGIGGFTQASADNTGSTILAGANTYNGSTTVTTGTLRITGSINNASAVSVASGSTLAISEANNSTQSNNIADDGRVVGAEAANVTNTLSGNISGTGSFSQRGDDTVTSRTVLTGVNTYSGNTTVGSASNPAIGGVLEIAGTNALSGNTTVTVNSGGTLLFTSSVNSTSTNIKLGGTLSLQGLSGGTVNLGSLTLTGNSTIDFGQLNATPNTLSFTSITLGAFTLTVDNWTGTPYALPASDDGTASQDRLLSGASVSGDPTTQVIFNADGGGSLGFGNQISYTGNGGSGSNPFELVPGSGSVAVPEPSTVFVSFGLLGLAFYHQRRRLSGYLSRLWVA